MAKNKMIYCAQYCHLSGWDCCEARQDCREPGWEYGFRGKIRLTQAGIDVVKSATVSMDFCIVGLHLGHEVQLGGGAADFTEPVVQNHGKCDFQTILSPPTELTIVMRGFPDMCHCRECKCKKSTGALLLRVTPGLKLPHLFGQACSSVERVIDRCDKLKIPYQMALSLASSQRQQQYHVQMRGSQVERYSARFCP